MSLLEQVAKTQFFWMCFLMYMMGHYMSLFPIRFVACMLILGQALLFTMKHDVENAHPHCLRYHSEE